MNKNIVKVLGFKEELEMIAQNRCPCCGKQVGPFEDEKSLEEWKISALCHECQDLFWQKIEDV